jgi:hypothetical protein
METVERANVDRLLMILPTFGGHTEKSMDFPWYREHSAPMILMQTRTEMHCPRVRAC